MILTRILQSLSQNVYNSEDNDKNLEEIESKCEDNILDDLPLLLPKLEVEEGKTSYKVLLDKVKAGLKERGKYKKNILKDASKNLK